MHTWLQLSDLFSFDDHRHKCNLSTGQCGVETEAQTFLMEIEQGQDSRMSNHSSSSPLNTEKRVQGNISIENAVFIWRSVVFFYTGQTI